MVALDPMASARAPESKLPMGVMPITIIEYSPMTRPRYESGIDICSVVLADAEWRITDIPITGIIARHNQNDGEAP
jgi:hypothetical protein